MRFKAVIFDFDGTLADTNQAIVAAKQETMRRLGLDVKDEKACAATIGLPSKEAFAATYPGLDDDILDKCVEVYSISFEEKVKEMQPSLFEGAGDVLERLKNDGIRLTLASSRRNASLHGFMDRWKMWDTFDLVLGCSDTEKHKPDPEPVLYTLKKLGVLPDEALVVGDMPYDIEMGKRAGAKTCAVTYGNASRQALMESKPEYMIDDIRELIKIIYG